MKKANILSVCLIAMVSMIGFSCEKNSEEKNYMEVEYEIQNIDANVVYMIYNDASGNRVETNDRGQFANGSKKLSVSTKPFSARMYVRFYNTSPATLEYTIRILINGEPKATESVICPPYVVSHGDVEYTLE